SLPAVHFSTDLIDACLHYAWPGNLRELENFVKRYLVMADEGMAMAELRSNGRQSQIVKELPKSPMMIRDEVAPANGDAHGAHSNGDAHGTHFTSVLRTLKNETELQAISRALQETHWN